MGFISALNFVETDSDLHDDSWRYEEGLSNPVANESAGLMITQTLRHLRHLRLEVSIFEGFIVLTIAGSS